LKRTARASGDGEQRGEGNESPKPSGERGKGRSMRPSEVLKMFQEVWKSSRNWQLR